MGSIWSLACPRRTAGSLSELGIPGEYVWEGLADDRIDAYYAAKDQVIEELEKSSGSTVELYDGSWAQNIPPQAKETLKGLLLRRAIGLVHVLKPIEEQRRSMRMMQNKGYLPDNHIASFERAEELCQAELKSLFEESQELAPEAPPNAIIQCAVQEYNKHGIDRMRSADDNGSSFEDVKRGFFQTKKQEKLVHGFRIGVEVEAHSLKTAALNGARGQVKGPSGADRVAVVFPAPLGEKALKPENLKIAPQYPEIHPDAKEAPLVRFEAVMSRGKGEPLGLSLRHEPPLEEQKQGQESCLIITGVLPDGHAEKYNAAHPEHVRLRPGDAVLAVVDGSVPESKQRPVGGNSKLILSVLEANKGPLKILIRRLLGPPVRFKAGQRVFANCGDEGWLAGMIVKVWEEESDSMVPYVVRLESTGGIVFAPVDCDQYIKKGDPRFKLGDHVMINMEDGYKKARISQVIDKGTCTAYKAIVAKAVIDVPEDLNQFVRETARFTEGTEVLAKMSDGYQPGKIEAVYHPQWVYSVRLKPAGNLVYVPEDIDAFVKKE